MCLALFFQARETDKKRALSNFRTHVLSWKAVHGERTFSRHFIDEVTRLDLPEHRFRVTSRLRKDSTGVGCNRELNVFADALSRMSTEQGFLEKLKVFLRAPYVQGLLTGGHFSSCPNGRITKEVEEIAPLR